MMNFVESPQLCIGRSTPKKAYMEEHLIERNEGGFNSTLLAFGRAFE